MHKYKVMTFGQICAQVSQAVLLLKSKVHKPSDCPLALPDHKISFQTGEGREVGEFSDPGGVEVFRFGFEDEVPLARLDLCDVEEDDWVEGEDGDDGERGEDQKGDQPQGDALETGIGLRLQRALLAPHYHAISLSMGRGLVDDQSQLFSHQLLIRIMNDPQANQPSTSETVPPLQHPLPLDNVLSFDEFQEQGLHEVEVSVEQAGGELGSSSILRVQVMRWRREERWQVSRRYEDCEWLFKALKNRFPGALLPYFPSITVQDYLESKLKTLNIKLHKQFYAPRVQEIGTFLSAVCRHEQWGKAEEVQVFLLKSEEFQRRKDEIARLVQEARISSKTFSIYSFFSRGFSWLSSKEEGPDPGNDLLRIRFRFNTYSTQLCFLLQKFAETIALKSAEIAWSGTSTEIDSVQRLKARILSGKPFIEKFISEVEGKLVVPLVQALKMEAQVYQQIEERAEAGKLLDYLRSSLESEEKIGQFAEHVQRFDRKILDQWEQFEVKWKEIVSELDGRFRVIWLDYSENMARIWK